MIAVVVLPTPPFWFAYGDNHFFADLRCPQKRLHRNANVGSCQGEVLSTNIAAFRRLSILGVL